MNVDTDAAVDLLLEYGKRVQRRDEHIARVQRERDELLGTIQHLHRDLELWQRALAQATGDANTRPLGAIYPRVS